MSIDARKYASRFIRHDDLINDPREEKITSVDEGNFGRLELAFESGDVLSLNATNVRTLSDAYGHAADVDWIGCVVEIYAGEVTFKGNPTPTVLLRTITPPKRFDERTNLGPAPKPKPESNDEIPF